MKSREEILTEAESLKGTTDTVKLETRFILLDLAGTTEADMFNEAGAQDFLYTLAADGDDLEAEAAESARKFIFG